jgi:hypothetical protein
MRLAVFLVCSGVGYLLGHYLPEPWASYVSILVSYHLFLAFLLITAEHEPGFSFPPILSIVVTHAACLALLIGLAMGRRYVPILGLVRIFVPGLAPFECEWLFSAGKKKKPASENENISHADAKADGSPAAGTPATAASSPAVSAEPAYTFEDHDDWLRYLGQTHRPFRKPGLSVGDEFKLWHEARAQRRATAPQNESSN